MPRTGPYIPWTSKTCFALQLLDDNDLAGVIDWVDPARPTDISGFAAWDSAKRRGTPAGVQVKGLIEGRPHREEAILVQLKGQLVEGCGNKCNKNEGIFQGCRVIGTGVHRGACGNCIWQSKAMECDHALAVLEQEADNIERRQAAKEKLLAAKDNINSSKRTKGVKAAKAALAPQQAPQQAPQPAPEKASKGRKRRK